MHTTHYFGWAEGQTRPARPILSGRAAAQPAHSSVFDYRMSPEKGDLRIDRVESVGEPLVVLDSVRGDPDRHLIPGIIRCRVRHKSPLMGRALVG